ncbi:pyrophosphate-energized vacuolar membrane proton pump-like [Zingiber officinale]|uniref:pyrophosphate-energized vacuolar membrane proton pump-like n=1 Tax=Zingiber officinale TaxID=94328 RepID=UPI001C4A9437|nr:pyrophosphate-energized vacuolar membrane proton pump-like [Zingiber officinale]
MASWRQVGVGGSRQTTTAATIDGGRDGVASEDRRAQPRGNAKREHGVAARTPRNTEARRARKTSPRLCVPRDAVLCSVSPALKKRLIISTALMAIGIAIVTWVALPSSFTIFNFGEQKQVKNWQLFFCVAIGLWTGLVIGFVTEYYTSNAYSPVQDVADSCRTGAATNVIFRLALGYKSIIIPIFAIGFSLAAMYAMAVAALGMLSTIATGLAIDAYGPISESAGGNVEMAGMSHRIRERTENNIYHSIIRFSRFAEAELKLFHSQHR